MVVLLALLFSALAVTEPADGVGKAIAAKLAGTFGDRHGSASAEAAEAAEPPAPAPPPPDHRELVDRYVAADLDEFLAYRDAPDRDPRLDWSTDFCSAPLVGSSGDSFDFTEACLRHDFGYRNYDRLGSFAEMRETVDERFYDDMRAHCDGRPAGDRFRCEAWAIAFYRAVRAFGDLAH